MKIEGSTIFLKKYRWLLLLMAAAVLFVVVNPASLFFLNDDFTSIPKYSQHKFTFGGSTRVFAAFVIYLDYYLYGYYAPGYIVTNLLLHIACCFLGYIWCKKVSKTFKADVPEEILFTGTLLFMWFGFHSETVLWTICRTASLGLLSFFSAWLCFIRFSKNRLWLIAAFISVLLGLLAYEILLLLPAQIAAWYFFQKHKPNRKTVTAWLFVAVVAILCFFIFKYSFTNSITSDYGAKNFSGLNTPVLVKNYLSLLIRTFAPPLQNKLLVVATGAVLLLVAAAGCYIIILKKRADGWWKFLLFNWLFSYIIFSSLGIDLSGNESDRYLYIPSFFFCNWCMYSIHLLGFRPKVKFAFITFIFIYHIFFFVLSVQNFRQAGTLAKRTLSTINESGNHTNTIVENLPAKAYGVPVLRMGVKNGLKWFYPPLDTANIFIQSEITLSNSKNYYVFYKKYYDTLRRVQIIRFFPF